MSQCQVLPFTLPSLHSLAMDSIVAMLSEANAALHGTDENKTAALQTVTKFLHGLSDDEVASMRIPRVISPEVNLEAAIEHLLAVQSYRQSSASPVPGAELSNEGSRGSAGEDVDMSKVVIVEGGIRLFLKPSIPPLTRKTARDWVMSLCPAKLQGNLLKTLPLGRVVRQDLKDFTEQDVQMLGTTFASVADWERIPQKEFDSRRQSEVTHAGSRKRKAEDVGNLTGTIEFFNNLSKFDGGSDASRAMYRNLAASSFALSQRVAASGLREAQVPVEPEE